MTDATAAAAPLPVWEQLKAWIRETWEQLRAAVAQFAATLCEWLALVRPMVVRLYRAWRRHRFDVAPLSIDGHELHRRQRRSRWR